MRTKATKKNKPTAKPKKQVPAVVTDIPAPLPVIAVPETVLTTASTIAYEPTAKEVAFLDIKESEPIIYLNLLNTPELTTKEWYNKLWSARKEGYLNSDAEDKSPETIAMLELGLVGELITEIHQEMAKIPSRNETIRKFIETVAPENKTKFLDQLNKRKEKLEAMEIYHQPDDEEQAATTPATDATPPAETPPATDATPPAETPTAENKETKPKKIPALRVCIICSELHHENLEEYKQQFREIDKRLRDKVHLIFYGYEGINEHSEILEGISYEYIYRNSIIHYFKQLGNLQLDLVFIPLKNDLFNQTSENHNKFMEAATFGVPILTVDTYPYNQIITSGKNGFLYAKRNNFVTALKNIAEMPREQLRKVGENAHLTVKHHLTFTDKNIGLLFDLFV